jgi:hypothetical protein
MGMWLAAVAPPDDQVQPGWLGFFVVLALGIVTYLLWRSMNTHLRRVNFDNTPAEQEGEGVGDGGGTITASDEPPADDGAGDA